MPDNTPISDIEIIRQFSAETRRLVTENKYVMNVAKKALIANGATPERASALLATALRAMTEELRMEGMS